MNKPVSFPIAKLVRLKGFDEECYEKYIAQCLWQKPNSREKYKNSDIHKSSSAASAPTIADVVMWIYNTHRIWISPYQYRDHAADANDVFVFRTHQTGMQKFESPIEAYEAAIKYVCEYKIK